MDNEAMHQSMQERMQRVEEALLRARIGEATEDDWFLIWYECGLSERMTGEQNESNCTRQRR